MARKGYKDELMRASERPDIELLRTKVELYYLFINSDGKSQERILEKSLADFDPYFFTDDDPDVGLAIIALAASMYDDARFLGVMAAGPLENLLRKPRPDILERVLAEARKNARFRRLLKGIFLHAVAEQVRPQIAAAIGDMSENDLLPPR